MYNNNSKTIHFFVLLMYLRDCDLPHILFNCSAIQIKQQMLFNTFNILFNLHYILNTKSVIVLKFIITFILETSFII